MKNKLENKEKIGILQVLKKILIDNPESANTIPELDQIEPTNEEEKRLLEELKKEKRE